MVDSARERLMVALGTARARPLTTLAVIAGVVIFLLLLGGNAGVAVLVSLLVVPAAILFSLTRLDLYEREPWALLASVVGAGALVGLLGGLLSTFFFERFWFSDSRLNLGAVGFSGISANGEGSVPFGVVLLSGILIPVLTGAAILGGPIALRRWPVFRNEITDGMTLGGLAAAAVATVSSFVYFWPSAFDDLPDRPVSQWTALLAGIVVIRPVVLILAGSLLGIAAWQYLSTKDMRAVLVAGVAGIFGWLALPLGSLLLTQSGAVTEFIWYAVVLIVVGVLFRQALGRSLATDQQVLSPAEGEQRVVCPNCHRVTPDGSFCSFCRAPLHPEAPSALDSNPTTGPVTTEPVGWSSADQPFAAPGSSAGGRSGQTPVMARETSTPTDSRRIDHDADQTADEGRGRLDELATEREADALDDVDQEPSDAAPTQGTADPSEPFASRVSAPRYEASSDTARFKRSLTDDEALASHAVTNGPDFDPDERTDEDTETVSTGQSNESDRPISLQDWSRRTGSASVPGVNEVDEAPGPNPPPASTQTGSSPWRRPADPGSEPVSGLKWPTSAASSIDRSEGGHRFPTDPITDQSNATPPDSDQPVGQPEQRPVASSSGRWFDASSGLGGSTPTSSSNPDTSAQHSVDEEVPSTSDALVFPADEQPILGIAVEPTESLEDSAKNVPGDEHAPPSGLRWYRQDDGDEYPDPSPADDEPEPPLDAGEWESDQAAPSETPTPAGNPDPSAEVEARPGIWRSFTRQGRGGAPRAPQRDQGQNDQES